MRMFRAKSTNESGRGRPGSQRATAPGRWLTAVALAFALAFLSVVTLGVQAASAAATSFAGICSTNPTVYVTKGDEASTVLNSATQTTGGLSFAQVGSANWKHNAVGMNQADMFMYAISQPSASNPTTQGKRSHLLRIASDGSATDLGLVNGFSAKDADNGITAGTFAPDGTYWVSGYPPNNGDGFLYTVNLNTRVATKITTTQPIKGHDLAYAYGYLWSMEDSSYLIQRIHPTTGAVTEFALPNWFRDADRWGTMWTYGNGNIGMGGNALGVAYQFSVTNPGAAKPTFNYVSSPRIPNSANNDGTACVGIPPVDLSVVKAASTLTPTAGANVTFTLTIKNNSSTGSSGFAVTDTLPSGFTNVTSTTPGCTASGNTVNCLGAALGAGASTVITITARAPSPMPASIVNTATVDGNESDPQPPNDSSSVTLGSAAPNIAVTKTADKTTVSGAGAAIGYTITATNTGNVPLTSVRVSDVMTAPAGPDPALTCTPATPVATLAVGGAVTCTGTYTSTSADVTKKSITNTASATGTPASGGSDVTATDAATVAVTAAPSLSLDKSANPATVSAAGQSVTYTFEVTNTGNVAFTDVGITEKSFSGTGSPPAATCTATTLGVDESTTCTAAYAVTQADINAGKVTNTATAHGTPPGAGADPVDSAESSAQVTATPVAALTLVKDATPESVNKVGEQVDYTFTVHNTGNVTLTSLNVTEESFTGSGTPPAVSCPVTTLAPDAEAVCTATYTTTQGDVDADTIDNTAVAHGTPPGTGAEPVDSPVAGAQVLVDAKAGITLVKSVSPTQVAAAGDEVTYTYEVTNTGTPTLKDLSIKEVEFTGTGTPGEVTCAETMVNPGETITCTQAYTVTQADIDAGVIDNTATAQATPPGSSRPDPVESLESSAQVLVTAAPGISLAKSASPASVTTAGQQIAYTFTVTNTGNVSVKTVSISEDAFSGTGTAPQVTCPAVVLGPQESTTCTATYQATQADIDLGAIDNTATAHATTTGADPVPVTSEPDSAQVTAPPGAGLTLAKSVSPTAVSKPGASLAYSFVVTNSGNVTLSGIGVKETAFTGTGTAPAPTCPATVLAPGAETTCTAAYAVTQADIDAGKVTNTAVANGTTPTEAAVTSTPSTAEVVAEGKAGVALVKSVTPTTVTAAGQVVDYTFEVTNTGSFTLTSVNLTEDAFSGTGTMPTPDCPATTLAPEASVTCTAAYTVTQADIDAGKVTNTATAHGTPPGEGTTPVDSAKSTAEVTATPATSIALGKTADPTVVTGAGQKVAYAFTVTNTGDATLTKVGVTETEFTGTGTPPAVDCPATTLAPDASVTCTAAYTVTQADIDARKVTNTATAHGTPPGEGTTPVESAPATADVTATRQPALSLEKSVAPSAMSKPGDATYTFTVTNTGNVTLHGLWLREEAFTGKGDLSMFECAETTLAPGASTVCTADYAVNQADIDAGKVDNTATAGGMTPDGEDVLSLPDSAQILAEGKPGLELVKTASPVAVGAAGQEVAYTFAITNTGNVTLHDVGVSETAFTGSGDMSTVDCAATTLAPQASTTCTAAYAVTQADIDAGAIDNTATAHGTPPGAGAEPVDSLPDSAQVLVDAAPSVVLVKTATPASVAKAGDKVTYGFAVTNTGNVTVSAVGITEQTFTGTGTAPVADCPATGLAPGETLRCTAWYTVTQADVNAGKVDNTAIAVATPVTPEATPISSGPSSAVVDIPMTGGLTLVKTPSITSVDKTGTEVVYTFKVTNTANVTITGMGVTELAFTGSGQVPAITCPEVTLAPGAKTACKATYTITQEEMDAGAVDNSAIASGIAADGSVLTSPEASARVLTTADAGLSLRKAADLTSVDAAGQKVAYTFTVNNIGNVTLRDVGIDETAFTGSGTVSGLDCPDTTLAPGDTVTCTAEYTVTQRDLDSGAISNTATAHGTPPGTDPVDSPPSSVDVTVAGAAKLTLAKTADPASVAKAADKVTYSFVVTNTGNLTVRDVGVDETAFTGSGKPPVVDCPDATLTPDDAVTCTATYAVTQADIDAQAVRNTAVAHGSPVTPGAPPVTSEPSSADVVASQVTGLDLTKAAAPATVTQAGTKVAYAFTAHNTGNVTLRDLAITESAFTGHGDMSAVTCPATQLAPGGSVTCTAAYTITQEDLDQGTVDNTAVAHTRAPDGEEVSSLPDSAQVVGPHTPALELTKTVDTRTVRTAGEKVAYTFVVKNTGNVTLTGVGIDEQGFTGSDGPPKVTCPANRTLGVGQELTCTATYTVTEADLSAGAIDNTAAAHGTPPETGGGKPEPIVSLPDAAQVLAAPAYGLQLTKTADHTEASVGQHVTYTFEVHNTSAVTMQVRVTEQRFTGTGTPSVVTCPKAALAPGAVMDCTARYQVTAADAKAGFVENAAYAVGSAPSATIASAVSTARFTVTEPAAAGVLPLPLTPGAVLAVTGSHPEVIGVAAALVLLAGGVLILLRRRGRSTPGGHIKG